MLSSLLVDWIKVLLKNQESCVINRGHATKYFKLEKGARQGDPISAYLFVLALEIFFVITKTNKSVHGLNNFDHGYLKLVSTIFSQILIFHQMIALEKL